MYFGDPTFILLIPAVFLALYAQYKVKRAYTIYSKQSLRSGMTGAEAARTVLQRQGLQDIPIEEVGGELSDHYDPIKRVLRLSSGVYHGRSVAAVGVAAHEAGHALQHASKYVPLHLRTGIYPVANIGSIMAWPLFFIGFLAAIPFLMNIGIVFFSGAVLFHLVTLPVEFNASKRAIFLLQEYRIVNAEEIEGSRAVLNAAALTYVAATAMAVLQLIRLLMLRESRD